MEGYSGDDSVYNEDYMELDDDFSGPFLWNCLLTKLSKGA